VELPAPTDVVLQDIRDGHEVVVAAGEEDLGRPVTVSILSCWG
jgi:hypothetical protein